MTALEVLLVVLAVVAVVLIYVELHQANGKIHRATDVLVDPEKNARPHGNVDVLDDHRNA